MRDQYKNVMELGEQLIRAGMEKRDAITGPSGTNIKLAKQAMDDVMPKLVELAKEFAALKYCYSPNEVCKVSGTGALE